MRKTIQLKLNILDGNIDGRWHVRIPGHSTWAYKIPKDLYKNCDDISADLCRPSVYLLFGESEEDNYPVVYVGETEDAIKRLNQHAGKKKYWSEAIVFGNSEWNSAYIKHLEGRLYELAKNANRYDVKNDTTPGKVFISDDEMDTMDTYLEDIQILAYALGHKVFVSRLENAIKDDKDEIQFFYLNMRIGKAKLMLSEGKYIVCAGSVIKKEEGINFVPSIHKLRTQLFKDGVIADGVLKRDIEFRSPSAAASFVTGNRRNGKINWKTEEGILLVDYMEGQS